MPTARFGRGRPVIFTSPSSLPGHPVSFLSQSWRSHPMPAPERYDVSVYERASLNLALTLYTDDAGTTLWNLTGYTAAFRIMDKPSGTVIATLTDGAGITLGGSAGTIIVKRTPAQVAAWKLDKGAYDLVITAADGTATLLLQGDLAVVKT